MAGPIHLGSPEPPTIAQCSGWVGMTQLHCLLLLTFVLSWIAPKNGSLTYRPKILCPRQVRLGYMPGNHAFHQRARPEFATHARLRSGMTQRILLQDTQTWRIGTHRRGGVEGLVGGYQFVHWKRPPGELVYARATDLSCLIKHVYNALYAVKGKEGTLLTMSARNEEKDTLIASENFRSHTKIKIQSVASSAGGTAMWP